MHKPLMRFIQNNYFYLFAVIINVITQSILQLFRLLSYICLDNIIENNFSILVIYLVNYIVCGV